MTIASAMGGKHGGKGARSRRAAKQAEESNLPSRKEGALAAREEGVGRPRVRGWELDEMPLTVTVANDVHAAFVGAAPVQLATPPSRLSCHTAAGLKVRVPNDDNAERCRWAPLRNGADGAAKSDLLTKKGPKTSPKKSGSWLARIVEHLKQHGHDVAQPLELSLLAQAVPRAAGDKKVRLLEMLQTNAEILGLIVTHHGTTYSVGLAAAGAAAEAPFPAQSERPGDLRKTLHKKGEAVQKNRLEIEEELDREMVMDRELEAMVKPCMERLAHELTADEPTRGHALAGANDYAPSHACPLLREPACPSPSGDAEGSACMGGHLASDRPETLQLLNSPVPRKRSRERAQEEKEGGGGERGPLASEPPQARQCTERAWSGSPRSRTRASRRSLTPRQSPDRQEKRSAERRGERDRSQGRDGRERSRSGGNERGRSRSLERRSRHYSPVVDTAPAASSSLSSSSSYRGHAPSSSSLSSSLSSPPRVCVCVCVRVYVHTRTHAHTHVRVCVYCKRQSIGRTHKMCWTVCDMRV